MVKSSTVSITPSQHAASHQVGGTDPLTNPLLLHAARHNVGGADAINRTFSSTSDMVGSRSDDTNYQNTSGSEMLVIVSGYDGTTYSRAFVKSSSPADTKVIEVQTVNNSTRCLTFIVPINYYYRVTGMGGTIQTWMESITT